MAEVIKRKRLPVKKRGQTTYQHKINRITAWYNRLLKFREKAPETNKHNGQPYKRRELKPLEYYLEKIKKPNNIR